MYYSITYYYRILESGRSDSLSNYLDDYDIKKELIGQLNYLNILVSVEWID